MHPSIRVPASHQPSQKLGFARLHCAVVDGAFAPATDGVVFHAASDLGANAVAQVQQSVRRRLLRGFARRGLPPAAQAPMMAAWEHSGGCSVDASVRIAAAGARILLQAEGNRDPRPALGWTAVNPGMVVRLAAVAGSATGVPGCRGQRYLERHHSDAASRCRPYRGLVPWPLTDTNLADIL